MKIVVSKLIRKLVISLLAFFLLHFGTKASPNIILILIDDLGWSDLGCYGNDFVETPHIDRLAKEGIRFTDFYASGAVCSPTRCAIQSGQNQARIGITDFISGHWRPFEKVITPRPKLALPLDIVSVAESLKNAGYKTGYVGKWHLGNGRDFQPDRQGYDFVAVLGGAHLPGDYRIIFSKQNPKSLSQNSRDSNVSNDSRVSKISNESNESKFSNVSRESRDSNDSKISNDSRVSNDSKISKVSNDSQNAKVSRDSKISNDSRESNDSKVSKESNDSQNAKVSRDSKDSRDLKISNDLRDLYRTEFEAKLGIDFIHQSAQSFQNRQPFFLMLSPYAVHIPLAAMSSKVAKYRQKAARRGSSLPHPVYAAMIEHCDDLVGRIVKAVFEAGIENETMILLTSDNGGLFRRYDFQAKIDDSVSHLAPLRGEKGNLYEGGIRVPLIVKYPPMIRAGSISAEPAISYDFYPTFLKLAEANPPANQILDGKDLTPILKNPSTNLDRILFWHYPHYHHGRPSSSLRSGNWKLIEYLDGTNEVELFDLSADIGESQNLAAFHSDRVAMLKKRLGDWRREVIAALPIPNPSYDPARASEWWSAHRGKPIASKKRKRYPPTEMQSRKD